MENIIIYSSERIDDLTTYPLSTRLQGTINMYIGQQTNTSAHPIGETASDRIWRVLYTVTSASCSLCRSVHDLGRRVHLGNGWTIIGVGTDAVVHQKAQLGDTKEERH